jgi:hypothetical protein
MRLTTSSIKETTVENPQSMHAGQKSLRRPSKNKELQLGTWNVLSLYRSGSLKRLIDITQGYKIGILAVQEMRWVGQSILEEKECTIYYSCHKSLHQFGTGFIINKNIRHLVIGFQLINMRIYKTERKISSPCSDRGKEIKMKRMLSMKSWKKHVKTAQSVI